MRAFFFGILLSAAPACTEVSQLRVSVPPGFDDGSELLFVFHGEEIDLYARDLTADSFLTPGDYPADTEFRFEAWHLSATLEELGLTVGAVSLGGEEGAPLFTPSSVAHAAGDGAWTLGSPSAEATALRLAGRPVDCLSRGGCFDGALCSLPCPEFSVDIPFPPEEAGPPDCPGGWTGEPSNIFPETCPGWVSRCPLGLFNRATGDCASSSDVCPDFPELSPGMIRVGARGGDFATIAEALAVIGTASGTIALGPGIYAEAIEPAGELRIAGACPAGVVLGGPIRVGPGARLELAGLTVEDELIVEAGQLSLFRTYLRDLSLTASGGAEIQAGNVALENVRVSAAGEGVRVALNDMNISGAASGIEAAQAAHVALREVWIEDAGGVSARDRGTRLEIDNAVFRGGEAHTILVRECATASVARTLIFGTGPAISAIDAGLVVTDTDIRYPRGFGVLARRSTPSPCRENEAVGAHRVRVTGAISTALQTEGATLIASDLDIHASRPEVQGRERLYGRGLSIQNESTADITRLRASRHHRHAIRVAHMSTVNLSHLRLTETSTGDLGGGLCPGGSSVDGASVSCDSSATIDTFLIDRNQCGIAYDTGLVLRNGRLRENSVAGVCGVELAPENLQRVQIDGTPYLNP